MELSMWTSYFMDLSPEEMVKVFSQKQWYKLELSDEHGKTLLDRGNPAETGRSFREYAKNLGVSFPQGHLWLFSDIIAENHEEVLDTLKGWLDLFLEIGVNAAVLHAGGKYMFRSGISHEKLLQMRIEAVNKVLDYIKGTDMTICIENTPGTIPTIDSMLELMEGVNSRQLGICLDTGHLNIVWGNQGEFIRKAGERLKALHIADNESETDQHLMPYGRGNVAWKEVVAALKDINYQGLFNYEIPGERNCPIPIRLAKLDYIKSMTEFMLNG